MTENAGFSMPFTVSTYESGVDFDLRLSSLLRRQQEAGERAVLPFGMDWRHLAAEGLAFVLASGSGQIHRMPRCGERVVLETWSDRVSGPRFYRGYRVLDKNGERLVESAALFALVNVKTHRLERPTADFIARLPSVQRLSDGQLPAGIKDLPPLEAVGLWTVPASAVDFNRHLNNTVYADLLTDFLPADKRHLTPRAYRLHYLKEAIEGDVLTVSLGSNQNTYTVTVQNGDTRCFVGQVIF